MRWLELAPFEKWNAQRAEKRRTDAVGGCTRPGDVGSSGRMKASDQRVAAERDHVRETHRRDAGDLSDPLDDAIGKRNPRLSRVSGRVESKPGDHPVFDVEAQIHAGNLQLAPDAQQRRHDEHKRHRDLGDDERLSPPQARGHGLPTLTNLHSHIASRRAQGRNHSTHERRGQHQHDGVRQQPCIHSRDVLYPRHRGRKRNLVQDERQHEPHDGSGHHQQTAFHQHRLDDAGTPGADGESNGNLAPPLSRAGHQQPAHVDARDDQHEPGHDQRQRRELPKPPLHTAELRVSGREHTCGAPHRRESIGIGALERCHERGHRRLGLAGRGARRQTRDDAERGRASFVERRQREPAQRRVDLRSDPTHHGLVSVWKHAHHGERLAVEHKSRADGRRIGAQRRPPELRGDDDLARLALRRRINR